MKVVTAEEMRKIDRKTIEEYRIPGSVLMERAGSAVASKIKEVFGKSKKQSALGGAKRKGNSHPGVIVIAGGGNNGGDGLVVARKLHNEGWAVKVFLTSEPEYLKGDALLQYKTAVKSGVKIYPINAFLTSHFSLSTSHFVIVDAVLGTGLSKNVIGVLSKVISLINKLDVPVISVDIPSGISSDNGQIMGEAVRADYTVTFGLPKRGHFLYPGAEYTGKLFIEDIGFPKELLRSETLNVELLEKNEVSNLIPKRQKYSHKGNYGHVLVVAGSRGKTGAALMAAKACLRSGAGLVTIGIPASLIDIFQSCVIEEMTLSLPDKGDGTLSEKASNMILDFLNEKADILAIGPGIGVSSDTQKLIKILIKNSTKPLVIDADGINALEGTKNILKEAKIPIILTPHPGEMARLLVPLSSLSELRNKIEQDRINTALSFTKETGTYLVLKGVPTIIAGPDGRAFINPTGNPGMATAGTGDVLTGMISGFLGQGLNPLEASILGVYMHGLAGDIAADEKGEYSLIATDIIDKIPAAFYSLRCDGINEYP